MKLQRLLIRSLVRRVFKNLLCQILQNLVRYKISSKLRTWIWCLKCKIYRHWMTSETSMHLISTLFKISSKQTLMERIKSNNPSTKIAYFDQICNNLINEHSHIKTNSSLKELLQVVVAQLNPWFPFHFSPCLVRIFFHFFSWILTLWVWNSLLFVEIVTLSQSLIISIVVGEVFHHPFEIFLLILLILQYLIHQLFIDLLLVFVLLI